MQTSTIHANFVQKYFGSVAEVKLYDTLDNALADLKAGRLDYVSEILDLARAVPEGKHHLHDQSDLADGPDLR